MASDAKGQPILQVSRLNKSFRGLHALRDIDSTLFPGEILGVIGPNGAGKTTLFNCLTGYTSATSGQIRYRGQDITQLRTPAIVQRGIARTFQNIRLFGALTVLDNVRVAQQLRTPFNLVEVWASAPSFRRKEDDLTRQALAHLELFGLRQDADQLAMNLPYGAQRRLEIARALATNPQILLLDEPAAGMNATETDAVHGMILEVRDRFNVSIILVEHDMRLVMNVCERIVVLNYGEVIAEGEPAAIRQNPNVIESYLGKVQS
ncbi:MAG: ABC transporter ATP-binding protein [Chloroflexi bacterium]|nr:ABC transporter ATP-binding protein [Chloroflexota bacterium]